jgi:hypothetical protein
MLPLSDARCAATLHALADATVREVLKRVRRRIDVTEKHEKPECGLEPYTCIRCSSTHGDERCTEKNALDTQDDRTLTLVTCGSAGFVVPFQLSTLVLRQASTAPDASDEIYFLPDYLLSRLALARPQR